MTLRLHCGVFGLCLLALALLSVAPAQQSPSLKLPDPEMQKLLGDWSLKLEYQPTKTLPQGLVTSGEERWSAGPGGRSLIEEFRESLASGEVTGLGIMWWNDQLRSYQVSWCDSANPSGCSLINGAGTWQNDQFTIVAEQDQGGKKFVVKEVFSDFSATSFKQALYSGETAGSVKLHLVITATRKSAPSR